MYRAESVANELLNYVDLMTFIPDGELPTERQCLRMDLSQALKVLQRRGKFDVLEQLRTLVLEDLVPHVRRSIADDVARNLVPVMNHLSDWLW